MGVINRTQVGYQTPLCANLEYVTGAGGMTFDYDRPIPPGDPTLTPEISGPGEIALPFFTDNSNGLTRPVTLRAVEVGAEGNQPEDALFVPIGGSTGIFFARQSYAGKTNGVTPFRSLYRTLLRALGTEVWRAGESIGAFRSEVPGVDLDTGDPVGLVNLLPEWERALGIPDGCFDGTGTDDERRRAVITKMASLGVQTDQDFIDLAAVFGVTVQVQPGLDSVLYPASLTAAQARFTIVVTFQVQGLLGFTYTFEDRSLNPLIDDGLLFTDSQVPILECLFARVKPANCQVIFLYAG